MDNESIWKTYSPVLKSWFSSELVYEGWGKASFDNPLGLLEGRTKIDVNELGDLKIEMDFEKLDTKVQISSSSETFRILKFLHQYSGKNDQVVIGIGNKNNNPCSKLTVKTDDGIFTSEGNITWSSLGLNDKIIFWITRGKFEVENPKESEYWVVPLTNLVTVFPMNLHPHLIQHPLRLYSTPKVPEMEDEKFKQVALFAANTRNRLVGFEFGEKIGYIEPLPDYYIVN